jgi:hypothetical protein
MRIRVAALLFTFTGAPIGLHLTELAPGIPTDLQQPWVHSNVVSYSGRCGWYDDDSPLPSPEKDCVVNSITVNPIDPGLSVLFRYRVSVSDPGSLTASCGLQSTCRGSTRGWPMQ